MSQLYTFLLFFALVTNFFKVYCDPGAQVRFKVQISIEKKVLTGYLYEHFENFPPDSISGQVLLNWINSRSAGTTFRIHKTIKNVSKIGDISLFSDIMVIERGQIESINFLEKKHGTIALVESKEIFQKITDESEVVYLFAPNDPGGFCTSLFISLNNEIESDELENRANEIMKDFKSYLITDKKNQSSPNWNEKIKLTRNLLLIELILYREVCGP